MGKKNTSYEGHVLVLPYPSQGHINPLLQFAKTLVSKGLKATIATTYYTLSSISAPFITAEPISDGFDDGGFTQAQSEQLYLDSFRSNGSRTLAQLIQKHRSTDSPITCIVYDSFLPWALEVAKENGISGGPFFTNSAAVSTIFSRIHSGTLKLPVRSEDCPVVLPGLPPLNLEDLPSFLNAPESYPAYLKMKLNQFRNLDKADWILSNTFRSLEAEVVKGIGEQWPAKLIGPMVPSAYLDGRIKGDIGYGSSLWKPLDHGCTQWLETKPQNSVVYVSFGSMVSLTHQETEEIAWGLHQSGFNFLWVVKDSERHKLPKWLLDSTTQNQENGMVVEDSERDKLPKGFLDSITQNQEKGMVVKDSERDKLPKGFLDLATRNQEKGMIVNWCNQLEILAHGSVGCFVTHCGWNSTLEGLSLGVSMVGVPKWTDQLTDAKFIQDVWRVGVRVKVDGQNGIVKREELVSCLNEAMKKDTEMKRNATKWKELAKEAISVCGSSNEAIDEFAEMVKSTYKKRDLCLDQI